MALTFSPMGDRAIRISIGAGISDQTNEKIHTIFQKINKDKPLYIEELISGFNTLTVYYNPLNVDSYQTVISYLKKKCNEPIQRNFSTKRRITIPVFYGKDLGPDLHYVANYHRMTEQELIARHIKPIYLVHMIGFAPGFPYLGGMDQALSTPRLSKPRKQVPAGAVGIAGAQTGVYSIPSPGGWQIIGHTPIRLFDIDRDDPILLRAGDQIIFKSVSKKAYDDISAQVIQGVYPLNVEWVQDGRECREREDENG